jgi:anti-sigma B factor antagonist
MSEKQGSDCLEQDEVGAVTVVRVKTTQPWDDDIARKVFDSIDTSPNGLVLNLSGVEQMTSLGLAKMVALNRAVRASNGRLALCHLSNALRRTLDSTRLATLFEIYWTEEEALRSFS